MPEGVNCLFVDLLIWRSDDELLFAKKGSFEIASCLTPEKSVGLPGKNRFFRQKSFFPTTS
ncbi:MAG: hypothetical protein DYG98_21310 [Haliscomenobacteraceae bacterium CHB4]|nr:hypothetical protein [Haliscomenobacteraceae bacterium CHB4]